MLKDLTTEEMSEMVRLMNDMNAGKDSEEEGDLSWGEIKGRSLEDVVY